MKFTLKRITLFIIISIMGNNSYAQLCQGSLGDPIVNITFGAGNNPGPPLAAATTSYQYVNYDCPRDGYYAVRSNTTNCFNTWFNLASDHTGDPNGFFMLVNATYLPSAFYLDTVKGLCGGTTYEFAAWITNVINASKAPNSIEPNLTFSIEKTDGTILKSYNTGNIPSPASPTWKQFGFFFTTPGGVSDIVLRIFNNAPGGNGNDLGLDDITFRPCGPQLTPSITGSSTNTVVACEGTAKSFTFNCTVSSGFNNPSFQWQENIAGIWTDIPGANTTTLVRNIFTNTPAGSYTYRLTVAEAGNLSTPQCRIASPIVTILVNINPVTTATNNGPVCTGNNLLLTATGGTEFSWTGPNGFTAVTATPTINNIQPVNAGKYYVQVKSQQSCVHTDSTIVSITPSPKAQLSFTNTTICTTDSVQLMASGGINYEWQPAANLSSAASPTPFASPTKTTIYSVIVSNQAMCRDTGYVTVNVIQKPTADAGPDRIIFQGSPVQLLANATGINLTYTWISALYINNPNLLRPVVNPPVDTKYILLVSSDNGCGTASDTVDVKLYSGIYIPNAFTPNGDNINDTWSVPSLNAFSNFELFVFNRYGEIVFKNSHSVKPWDGKYKGQNVPIGAYTYFIDLKTGKASGMIRGTVLVLR